MTIETLRIIHQSYQEALEKSANLLEIAENLYEILNEIEISNEEDVIIFDSFLDGLRGCIQNRRKTFEITNLSIYIIITMMYIVLWLNSTKNMHIDIKWKARCKALESELTKLIRKSNSNLSANIRDRFGLKGIVQNDLKEKEIETPICKTTGYELDRDIILVPILRAGVGLVDGFRRIMPTAKVGHIGMYRDEETLIPHEYYAKFPKGLESAKVIVLDPMLATGGSADMAIQNIKDRGAKDIELVCLVGAPEGVKYIEEHHPDVKLTLAALDEKLNDKGYIVPGLGDAGDRLFGTN